LDKKDESRPEEVKTSDVIAQTEQHLALAENQEIKPAIVESPKLVSKTTRKIKKSTMKEKKESKFLLKSFFSHLLDFEANMEVPVLQNLPELFILEADDKVKHLTCRDDIIASKLEIAISWHLNRTYKVAPVVVRDGGKITIDYSLSQKSGKERMITNRSYCLAPIEQTTISDMKKRLHRVYFSAKPIVEKTDGYFCIKYQSNRVEQVTKTVNTIISEMGWRSKIEDGNLLVFPGSVPIKEKIEIIEPAKNTETIEPVVTPVVSGQESIPRVEALPPLQVSIDDIGQNTGSATNVNHFFVINNKEEGLAKLKKYYNDPILYSSLTEETKNDIFLVLAEDWEREHPEEYARALLDFLKE